MDSSVTNEERVKLIEYLREFASDERLTSFNTVLDERTRHLTVVLEDLHKPHNANAVLRSCDGFGIQDVHIIENRTVFGTEGTVSIGAHQWLTLHRYRDPHANNITACIKELRNRGYRIVATTPHTNDILLPDLDVTEKTALVFGTELDGVSDELIAQADACVRIPMYGFSESYNLSVSAAICLYEVTKKIRASGGLVGNLSESEKNELRLQWLKRSIKASEKILQRYYEQ
jgi:tRNA (guanosine-2'-O-)-methyltransferase